MSAVYLKRVPEKSLAGAGRAHRYFAADVQASVRVMVAPALESKVSVLVGLGAKAEALDAGTVGSALDPSSV